MMDTGSSRATTTCPAWVWFFLCGVVGLATSIAFVYITQYYTAGGWRPVKDIAEAIQDRPGHEHHRRHRGRLRDDVRDGHRHRHRAASSSFWLGEQAGLLTRERHERRRHLRHRRGHDGHAHDDGLHPRDGHVRPHHRQRRRHRRVQPRPRAAPARSPTSSTRSATRPRPSRRAYAIASASLAAFLLFSAYIDKVNLILGSPDRGGHARDRGRL